MNIYGAKDRRGKKKREKKLHKKRGKIASFWLSTNFARCLVGKKESHRWGMIEMHSIYPCGVRIAGTYCSEKANENTNAY